MLGRLGELGAPARQAMMLHALERLPQLAQGDRVVLDHLRVSPFVETKAGALQPPSALYDPRSAPFLSSGHAWLSALPLWACPVPQPLAWRV